MKTSAALRSPATRAAARSTDTFPAKPRKNCAQCRKVKTADQFWPTGTTADRLTARCKHCIRDNAAKDRTEREARKAAHEAKASAVVKDVGAKACVTCHVEKPFAEFARHGQSADGHRRSCKSCVATAKVHRKPMSTAAKAKDRARRQSARGKDVNSRAVRSWKERNPEALHAMSRVRVAIKMGVLARPPRCQVKSCRWRGKPQAHHFDYSKPLLVSWLCPTHHRRRHAGEELEIVDGLSPLLLEVPANRAADLRPIIGVRGRGRALSFQRGADDAN